MPAQLAINVQDAARDRAFTRVGPRVAHLIHLCVTHRTKEPTQVDPIPSPAPRPLGWWLKEADARIEAAFDRALGLRGLDRRRWQILATLTRGPSTQHGVAAALSRFDSDAEIAAIVADLVERRMLRRGGDDQLEITDRGTQAHEQAAREVDVIRTRVATALGHDGHEQLIGLLARLVEAFPDSPSNNGS